MTTIDDVPMPPPWDYCYEWDGPYGTRKFSTAAHNGNKPSRTVPLFTESQMRGYAVAWALEAMRPFQADAERYRWLRHGDNDERCIRLTSQGDPYMLRGEMLDRCIDDGLAADAQQEAHTVEWPGVGAA